MNGRFLWKKGDLEFFEPPCELTKEQQERASRSIREFRNILRKKFGMEEPTNELPNE